MAASVTRLRTKAGLMCEAHIAQARQLVLGLENEAPREVRRVLALLDREAAAGKGWTFCMLEPAQNAAVARWLRHNSKRPLVALVLWAELFNHLCRDTGEIAATRQQLAEAVGAHPTDVSAILSELVKAGALIRHMDGKCARFFMNPRVGTHLGLGARELARAGAPELNLAPREKPRRKAPKLRLVSAPAT